jgi:hypothetical protein
MQCALYCKHGAKYSAHLPVYAIWTVVPDMYNVFTATQIRASLINLTYVSCYWRYIDNSMCVLLQTWCQIQRSSCSLRYLDCGSGHIQCTYSSTYAGFNIELNVSPPFLEIHRQFNVRYTANMVPNTAHILQCRYLSCAPGRIQCKYISAYSGFNIQLTYLRLYWRYIDNSMCVILQPWCQIQRASSGLRYMDCGPGPYTM